MYLYKLFILHAQYLVVSTYSPIDKQILGVVVSVEWGEGFGWQCSTKQLYTRHKNIENVMLVRLATQTSKKHTNKCVDGSTHYRIKVTESR